VVVREPVDDPPSRRPSSACDQNGCHANVSPEGD
jgi:hypothetical protein